MFFMRGKGNQSVFQLLQIAASSMFVASMAFFAKISDPAVGGTYMTFLNTLSNLGGNWPATTALWFVDALTIRKCSNNPSNDCGDDLQREVIVFQSSYFAISPGGEIRRFLIFCIRILLAALHERRERGRVRDSSRRLLHREFRVRRHRFYLARMGPKKNRLSAVEAEFSVESNKTKKLTSGQNLR